MVRNIPLNRDTGFLALDDSNRTSRSGRPNLLYA